MVYSKRNVYYCHFESALGLNVSFESSFTVSMVAYAIDAHGDPYVLADCDHLIMPRPLPLPMAEPFVEPAIPPALVPRAAGVPLPLDMELAPRVVLDEVVDGGTMVDLFVRVVFGVGGFSTKLVSVVLETPHQYHNHNATEIKQHTEK